ncbi:hypothetical protein MKW98_027329, partial [Papaver atlanticum]
NPNELDIGKEKFVGVSEPVFHFKTIYTAGVIMLSQTLRVAAIPSVLRKNQRFRIPSNL